MLNIYHRSWHFKILTRVLSIPQCRSERTETEQFYNFVSSQFLVSMTWVLKLNTHICLNYALRTQIIPFGSSVSYLCSGYLQLFIYLFLHCQLHRETLFPAQFEGNTAAGTQQYCHNCWCLGTDITKNTVIESPKEVTKSVQQRHGFLLLLYMVKKMLYIISSLVFHLNWTKHKV